MNNTNAFGKKNHAIVPRQIVKLMALATAIFATAPSASAQELLTNGDFETGDFTGWTVVNQPGGAGDYYISTPGSASPAFGHFSTAPNPSGGESYAISDTDNPGSHVIYQGFTVAGASQVTVSYQMFVNTQSGGGAATPPTLNFTQGSNQQARVDILNSIASPFTVTTGVVRNFYDGVDGGANPNPYVTYTFTLGLAPGTYYLRFAEVDNQGVLNQGFDNVSVFNDGILPAISAPSLTSNQQSVLSPINQGINSGSSNARFATILSSLLGVAGSPTDLGSALDSFSPEKLQMFTNVAFDNFGFTARGLDAHLASRRYGHGGLDTSGLQVLDPSTPSSLSQIKSRLLAFNPAPASRGLMSDSADPVMGSIKMTDAKDMEGVGFTDQNRFSTFISGNVILADVGGNADVPHGRYATGGVMAGTDYRIDENWAVGGSFGYGHTSLTLDNIGSKGRIDSYSPGVYATYADHGWFANGFFQYSYNTYGENRVIPVLNDTTHGSTTGNQYSTNLDGGYEFKSGNLTFGPTAALQYVHLDINNFTESGAGALDINDQNADSLRTRFGGQMRYNWSWYGGKVTATPYLGVSWQHEYLNNSRGITSSFDGAGLGAFTVTTNSPDRDSAVITAGIDTQWNNALSFFLDYQAQAGQSDFFAQSVQGGAKISY